MTEKKVHHNTRKGADIALAKRLISRSSHEAVLAGTLSLNRAKELGREGGPGARTSRGGSRASTERPPEGRERQQESTERACLCGCREPVSGKKSRFRPGHDARLYGELKRNLESDPLLRNERFTLEQKAYAKDRGLV